MPKSSSATENPCFASLCRVPISKSGLMIIALSVSSSSTRSQGAPTRVKVSTTRFSNCSEQNSSAEMFTATRKPVKNADLWRLLDAAAQRHQVTWKWLKGHAGHPENERCDALAAEEIAKIQSSHSRDQLAALLKEFAGPPAADLFQQEA